MRSSDRKELSRKATPACSATELRSNRRWPESRHKSGRRETPIRTASPGADRKRFISSRVRMPPRLRTWSAMRSSELPFIEVAPSVLRQTFVEFPPYPDDARYPWASGIFPLGIRCFCAAGNGPDNAFAVANARHHVAIRKAAIQQFKRRLKERQATSGVPISHATGRCPHDAWHAHRKRSVDVGVSVHRALIFIFIHSATGAFRELHRTSIRSPRRGNGVGIEMPDSSGFPFQNDGTKDIAAQVHRLRIQHTGRQTRGSRGVNSVASMLQHSRAGPRAIGRLGRHHAIAGRALPGLLLWCGQIPLQWRLTIRSDGDSTQASV